MDRACRSHAGTVELQRMAVVRVISQTLLMPLFHKSDGGTGLCFEQGWQSMALKCPLPDPDRPDLSCGS